MISGLALTIIRTLTLLGTFSLLFVGLFVTPAPALIAPEWLAAALISAATYIASTTAFYALVGRGSLKRGMQILADARRSQP